MRLIDADALLEGREDHEMISTHLIWNAPTIDAEPVRHGHWINIGYEGHDGIYYCSCCGASDKHYSIRIVPYCWNCGSKMDNCGNCVHGDDDPGDLCYCQKHRYMVDYDMICEHFKRKDGGEA